MVDHRIGRIDGIGERRREHGHHLVRRGQRVGEPAERLGGRRRGGEHLVHGRAGLVEHLDRTARAARAALGHEPGMRPAREEQAEVDLRAEHQPDAAVQPGPGVGAVLLVHAVVVARQRHQLAGLGEAPEQKAPVGAQAACAGEPGDDRGLGHAERLGGVAHPELRPFRDQRGEAVCDRGACCVHGSFPFRLTYSSRNCTGTSTQAGTARPPTIAGWNAERSTASTAARSSSTAPALLWMRTSTVSPSGQISTRNTTVPSMPRATAWRG
jgi:hypothetical protein